MESIHTRHGEAAAFAVVYRRGLGPYTAAGY
jgi:hypothetical protein